MEQREVRCRQDENRGNKRRRELFTDRWMDNVLMSQDPPGATAVCLCHSPLSSLSPPPVSPSITRACLLSFHLVSCTCHTFPPVSSPLFSSPLSNLLFPLMDISNVHHYVHLGEIPFCSCSLGRPCEIIHSLITSLSPNFIH